MPTTRSPSSGRKAGRDLMRAYQSLAFAGIVPIHVAEIVERRQMRGERKIGQRHLLTCQPAARRQEIGEIMHVLGQVGLGGAQCGRVGRAGLGFALADLFLEQIAGHFVIELDHDPFEQPPHLGSRRALMRHQAAGRSPRMLLFDVMDHRQHADDRGLPLLLDDGDRTQPD